ncbi:ribonuclease P protein component [Aliikangiella maris]|uniref:Ribonuclease P protein component n=2 Tax=Aliikangiella maris TaxID=3162458 RepID=A0ABV2BY67_9GAMM
MDCSSLKFQRERRLLNSRDYSHVFDSPRKIHNKAFTLLVRQNQFTHPRLGLIIAKKNLKLAHQRNWVKRILREGFRLQQNDFQCFDMVILTRRDIAVLSKKDIIHLRDDLFERFRRKCK